MDNETLIECHHLDEIADRIERMESKGRIRFSVLNGVGWLTCFSEETIRTMAMVYNNRKGIAAAPCARSGEKT